MTEEKSTPIPYHKKRGLRGCIMDGWKIFAFHAVDYLRYIWFPALLAGLGITSFILLAMHLLTSCVQPATLLIRAGMKSEIAYKEFLPGTTETIGLILCTIFMVATVYLMKGASWAQIDFYKQKDHLPRRQSFFLWKKIISMALRNLVFDLAVLVPQLLLVGLLALCAWLLPKWAFLTALAIVSLLCVYIGVIEVVGRQGYLLSHQTLKNSFRMAFAHGMRYFGAYLLVLLLTAIPLAVLSFILLLPFTLFLLSCLADNESVLMGEISGLPGHHIVLFLAVSTLAFALCAFAASLRRWPLALKAVESGKPGEDPHEQ